MAAFRRRTFLQTSGAALLSSIVARRASGASNGSQDTSLVFTGVTPELPAGALPALAGPLFENGWGLSIALDVAAFAANAPTQELLNDLEILVNQGADLFPFVKGLSKAPAYFQARIGHDARAHLVARFPRGSATGAALSRTALIGTLRSGEPLLATGLRAAAFRTVLQLPADRAEFVGKVGPEEVLVLDGGALMMPEDITEIPSQVASEKRRFDDRLIVVSLESVTNLGAWTELFPNNTSVSPTDSFGPRTSRGFMSLTTYVDANFPPVVPLLSVVVTGVSATNREASYGFASELSVRKVPVTFLPSGGTGPDAAAELPVPPQEQCLPVAVPIGIDAAAGINEQGTLLLARATVDRSSTSSNFLRRDSDVALLIDAEALQVPRERTALVERITSAAGRFAPVTLPELARRICPDDPVIRLQIATKQDEAQTQSVSDPSPDTSALREDAAVAWSYFERFTANRTGLCITTAQIDGNYVSTYDQLAMWDIGSHLLGIRGAWRLGLIERKDFLARCEAVIVHLPRVAIDGKMLPCSLIHAGSGLPAERDYNPSDVGRLLSALDLLRREPELAGPIAAKIGSWDLDKATMNGRLAEIVNGRMSEFYVSQGTNYATRAFAAFGITANSPYPDHLGDPKTDWQMRLLYAAAKIGPLGPEPLLFEGIEMGFSRPARYLADVLFAAQYRTARATGEVICPSESAINKSPWFVYEGLDLGGEAGWIQQSGDDAMANQPGKALTVPHFVNSKAAYLWRAVHPHPYSLQLVNYVRKRARIPGVGIASAIYTRSGEPTVGYTDINTNGIILCAIDVILNGAG